MRPRDVRALIRPRRPILDPVDRTLAHCHTIDDLRRAARRRWPEGVRGYVDGGADGEVTVERNRTAYERFSLLPHPLRDVTEVDTRASLLGVESALPFALAPTGYTRMMHNQGEPAVTRAAGAAGIPYTLSTVATTNLEDVARESTGDLWFQLYVWRDRALMRDLVARARDHGYRALMLTVDTPVTGLRARDLRAGFTVPPTLTPSTILQMAAHPVWCARMLTGAPITFANIPGFEQDPMGAMAMSAELFDASVSWDDLAQLRELWSGPLVVKGLVRPDDVRQAASLGVDGVVLSNHGGRQLDQTIPPIDALPQVRDAVGDSLEVYVDSGIRRGTDLVIALARGATGCLVGRPYLYGLGAGGERGVTAAITMLADELRRAMQLLGVTSIAQLRQEGETLVRDTAPGSSRRVGADAGGAGWAS
jgi:L-lactate dehydrogenase (cytochrome)